jgi:hypothetical protein
VRSDHQESSTAQPTTRIVSATVIDSAISSRRPTDELLLDGAGGCMLALPLQLPAASVCPLPPLSTHTVAHCRSLSPAAAAQRVFAHRWGDAEASPDC